MRIVLALLLIAFLAGCGGGGAGGGAGGSAANDPANSSLPTAEGGAALVIDLDTEGGSARTVVYGVELTLLLPAGVTVRADSSGAVGAAQLNLADGSAVALARYTPASDSRPASVTVTIADPAGFLVGDLAALSCSDASGGSVGAAGITVERFSARDQNGVALPEVSLRLSVRKV